MQKEKTKGRRLRIAGRVYLIIVLILLYAPVAVMIRFSFNNSRANVTWQGFTLKYYKELFSDGNLWDIFFTTLFIALLVTVIGTIIGTMGAVGLRKAHFPGKKLITNSVYFPIVIPEIVLAVAMLLMFNGAGISLGLPTIVIGNVTLVLPYVYITVKARLVGMDPSTEEASMDLGADRFYTFTHITLPEIMPGIIAGAFMSFSLVLDELIITSFLTDAETVTLPIKVYSMIKKGISPEINALTTIVFLAALLMVVVYFVVSDIAGRKKKKKMA
ncbi:MAG: ABC transporter permease [Lachnospiraceae bacterium]|nr:ABC transporter permease [Lachnospiraceae bacterium]